MIMATALFTSRALGAAAKRRLAASSVAPVASGYERSLRPCEARFSLPEDAACSKDDR
jgi:hypothetical protein